MNLGKLVESEANVQNSHKSSLAEKQDMQHLEDMKQKECKELEVSSQGNKRKLESVIEKKKKRSKQHRILKTTLAILKPESQTVQEEKASNFAQAYFWKVKSRLTGTAFSDFVQELVNFEASKQKNVVELYRHVKNLFAPHTGLIDEFLAFLLPYQALEIGRFIDYFFLIKMKEFCTKLEGCLFPKQVQQVLNTLEHLAGTPSVTLSDVHSAFLPYLKSSPLLSDYFHALLPGERPPDSLQQLTECEHMDCSDEQNEECVETMLVPDCYDPYGGENCPCACHVSQIVHCTSCGVKFINGRVYMQYGKILRPAKVVFKGENQSEMLESKWRFVGNSKTRTQAYKRIHPSPFKSHTSHNYDDHRIGTESEDDFNLEHGKSALSSKKSPKTARMKSAIGSKHKNTTKSVSRKEETIGKEICSLMEGVTPLVTENFQGQVETSNNQFFLNNRDSVTSLTFHTKKYENLKDVITQPIDLSKTNKLYVEKKIVLRENFKKSKFEVVSSGKINKNKEKEIFLMSLEEKFETDDNCHLDYNVIQNRKSKEIPLGPVFDINNVNIISNESDEGVKDDNKSKQNIGLSDSSEKAENGHQITVPEDTNQTHNTAIFQYIVNHTEEKRVIKTENKIVIPSDKSFTNYNIHVNITEGSSSKNKHKVNVNDVCCQKAETEISKYSDPAKSEQKMSVSLGNQQTITPKSAKITKVLSWTREEDKVILQAFQQENDTEQTFNKINQRLSNRTIEEIQTRFQVLMQLLKEMTSVSNDGNL